MITSGYTRHDLSAEYFERQRQQLVAQQPKQQPQQSVAQQQPKQQPQQPKAEKKSHQFHMRMTNKQHMKLKRLKKLWNLKTEAAVVDKLIETCAEGEKPQSQLICSVQELTQIRKELNRIGINVNQIAKVAHQSALTTSELSYLQDVVKVINRIIYGGD